MRNSGHERCKTLGVQGAPSSKDGIGSHGSGEAEADGPKQGMDTNRPAAVGTYCLPNTLGHPVCNLHKLQGRYL